MASENQEIVTPLPSASVIVVRENAHNLEVLLVQRNAKIKFHGGAWVFPGGKFDAQDHEGVSSTDLAEVARVAAVRETSEEVGLDISGNELVPFSHWLTPEQQPKRFSTWFFITEVDLSASVVIDDSEIVDHRWLSVEQALTHQGVNEMTLPPPTFVSLIKLQALRQATELPTFVQQMGYEEFAPRIVENDEGRIALYHGDAGFDPIDLAASGARHRLNMLKAGWHYEDNR